MVTRSTTDGTNGRARSTAVGFRRHMDEYRLFRFLDDVQAAGSATGIFMAESPQVVASIVIRLDARDMPAQCMGADHEETWFFADPARCQPSTDSRRGGYSEDFVGPG